ncbi:MULTISPECIES: hypothetical protein [Vibrio harveyi group]|uniref:hypothetical protein n=1 Tax=Vibrio harveyi group TaxID=717610 RepID=UPI0015F63517|nr:hypothetical protein [Vibrio alginolyticus]EJE4208677.1 hypothetical protein [Vibrio parahaemolyticus]HDM8060785.1 hypothetical protein [Vibrio harveyi]
MKALNAMQALTTDMGLTLTVNEIVPEGDDHNLIKFTVMKGQTSERFEIDDYGDGTWLLNPMNAQKTTSETLEHARISFQSI